MVKPSFAPAHVWLCGRESLSPHAPQRLNGEWVHVRVARTPPLGLYKIFVHFKAFVHESVILV